MGTTGASPLTAAQNDAQRLPLITINAGDVVVDVPHLRVSCVMECDTVLEFESASHHNSPTRSQICSQDPN